MENRAEEFMRRISIWYGLAGKKGKELFKNDFLDQLNASPYWKMIKEDGLKQ